MAINIFDYNHEDLVNLAIAWDEPAYRADQIWQGLYKHFFSSLDQFTTLSKSIRSKLEEHIHGSSRLHNTILTSLSLRDQQYSTDGETQKILFELKDNKLIETVLMRYHHRRTICVSTQSGCALGCTFCGTGQLGFFRSLTSGEIVEQIIYFARLLAKSDEKVTNVVMMGMGEPFHNYEATMAAIDRLSHPSGLNLGARRFTISTVGLVPMIERFTKEKRQVNLAVSLHAADDEMRSSMMPINQKYPLKILIPACLEYVKRTKRRITFEWALIDGVNDTLDQAKLLAQRLQPFLIKGSALCHVNAIPLNPTQKFSGEATSKDQAQKFRIELENRGIPCSIRLRRGIDIQAGCGQLAGQARH